jgi:hypothetical protein
MKTVIALFFMLFLCYNRFTVTGEVANLAKTVLVV